jgi:hypothetical protein
MRLDDGTSDCQAHAETIGFGRKKGVEYLVCMVRTQPDSGIGE